MAPHPRRSPEATALPTTCSPTKLPCHFGHFFRTSLGSGSGEVPFQVGNNSSHHWMSARASAVIRTRWRGPETEQERSSSLLKKTRTAGTQRAAWESLTTRDWSSFLVHFRRSTNSRSVECSASSFSVGREIVRASVSITRPSNVILVAGAEHFSVASGTPSSPQTCSTDA